MIATNIVEKMNSASWIRAMFEEGAKMKKIYGEKNVYDFTLGNPNLPPPSSLKTVIPKLLIENDATIHKYMNNAGFEDVRLAIANHINQSTTVKLNQKHIIMTVGAAGALNVILKTILNPRDEVMILAPYFVEYLFYIENHGGLPVAVKTKPGTFQLDLDGIEKNITKNTKAIIINSPNNPSGAIYSQEDLEKLSTIIRKKNQEHRTTIYLISDEPYREMVYDQTKVPNVFTLFDDVLMAYSYSKSLSLAGERIGYIAVKTSAESEDLLISGLIFSNRILGFVNAPALFQKVIKEIQGEPIDFSPYQEKRDVLYQNLRRIGYNFTKPAGTFYFFVESLTKDDIVFVKKALEYRLLFVPGSGFGYSGYFRISYCTDMETIEDSIGSFQELYNYYRR
jgi:aspartate aminotransferase